MTRLEVHQELTLLGVSSEVHCLVDDLDLTLRDPPFGERLICFPKKYKPFLSQKNVYQPHTIIKEECGWLFDNNDSPVRQVRRVSLKEAKRVRGVKRS